MAGVESIGQSSRGGGSLNRASSCNSAARFLQALFYVEDDNLTFSMHASFQITTVVFTLATVGTGTVGGRHRMCSNFSNFFLSCELLTFPFHTQ